MNPLEHLPKGYDSWEEYYKFKRVANVIVDVSALVAVLIILIIGCKP